ncbi:MAG: YIP1 family protein [Candidatus Omnitrophica bacterium]|nr:YIP1 family protein [Candidatus Omnitrophota bacterium]
MNMENTGTNISQGSQIPWQDRKNLGTGKAIIDTIKYVLFKPNDFFSNLTVKDSLAEPYIFYLIVSLATGIIGGAIQILFKQNENLTPFMLVILILIGSLLGIFITSAVIHLSVMLVGGKGGFKGTFNVLAYNASSAIFSVIPFIGQVIAGIWGIVIGVKGFKKVHNLNTLRAVIAYFGIFFIIAIIALMAAIAIPNLIRARRVANDASAKATVRMISTAVETYSVANNGGYPISEYDLKKGGYISEYYDKNTKHGYSYAIRLDSDGYEITANPQTCGTTGTKVFVVSSRGDLTETDCK